MDDLRPRDEHEDVSNDPADEPAREVIDRLAAYAGEDEDVVPTDESEIAIDPESTTLELAEEPRRFGRRGARPPKPEKSAKPPKQPRQRKEKRAKKLVGLKIGASQLAAAHVVNNGSPELIEVAREPLEQGVVVAGEIRDPEALGDALKRFFELHKLPKNTVRIGVANNRIGVRTFEIEGISDPQMLENAIRFRAEEVLPIPLDQAVLDYVVLDERTEEDGTEWRRIMLVVAYRDVIDRYLQACERAGLQVVGIDYEAFALLRALRAPRERDAASGALIGISIGHDRTTIAVSNGVNCEFARVLDWGGWSLNVAIARELDRAPTEVESIKRQLALDGHVQIDGLTDEQVAKVKDAVQRALGGFAREIVSSLQFYQAQPGSHGIGEIVMTGGAAHMAGLSAAVAELVGVPIRLGDPGERVQVGSKVDFRDQPRSFSVAIGLGIED